MQPPTPMAPDPFGEPRPVPAFRKSRRIKVQGLTLIETLMAIGVLAMTSMGGIAAFLLLNWYASNLRNVCVARALCQERIEQGLTEAFRPANAVVPTAPSADPTNGAARAILGGTSNYSSTGAYTGTANMQTSTETIPIYEQSTGTAAANSPAITYTRTSTISPAPLYNTTAGGATSTSLNDMVFTVTVGWMYRGRSYTTSMYTLRSSD